MATGGKKGKKNKGKTIALTEFLGDAPPPAPRAKSLWSDNMEDDPPIPAVQKMLPTAPRAARGNQIDESLIPQNGPFMAYISNLPYEIDDMDLTEFFKDFTVTNLRLPRDDRTNRIRGFGYVEFPDKASLVGALQIVDMHIKGRPIRIEIAESGNEGNYRRGGMRDRDRDYDSGRSSTDWRASRSDNFMNDDRRGGSSGSRWEHGGGFNRDSERGGADTSSNWREGRRPIEDRPRDTWSDSRNSERSFGGGPRRNYGADRDRGSSPPPVERVRPKLNLKTLQDLNLTDDKPALPPPLPKAEEAPRPPKPSAASIFGGAKPVDTSAREREIEERLAKDRVVPSSDPDSNSRAEPPRDRTYGKRDDRDQPPPENAWARRSQQHPDRSPPARPRGDSNERAPRSYEDDDYRRRSDDENDRYASRGEDDVDRREDARKSDDRVSGTSEEPSQDRVASNDRDSQRGRSGDRDRARSGDRHRVRSGERDRVRSGDRDRVRSGDRDRVRSGDTQYGRERYQPPSRDRYRDHDGDRNYNRDRDRDRGSYRDNDRYRNRDDRGERGRDRGREDRYREERGREDRYRDDRDRGRDDRRRPDSREDKDRDGYGRPSARPSEPKDNVKESRPPKEIPKVKEPDTPNYVAPNKYSSLEEGAASE